MDLGSQCGVHESVEDNEGVTNDSSKPQINGSCIIELNQKEVGHVELKTEALPTTRKGYGLKKWRRIKRDTTIRGRGSGSIDSGEMVAQELGYSGANRSKRVQYTERKEKSEGSVSSTNAVVRNFDGFSPQRDDLENSEDRSSKSSSTAVSAPKTKYDIPLSKANGNNLAQQRGKGKGGKKARGEGVVKIEKENSHSSVESDSRSCNFVFVQGAYNGVRNEDDGENGEAVHGIGKQVNDGGYGEGFDDDGHKDPVAESMGAIQSAQEALGEEVLKIKEIGSDVSVDGPISDLCKDVEEQKRLEIREVEEQLFKQKVEAEVECLALSTTVQKLRVDGMRSVLKNYKAEQTQILHNKAEKSTANAEELLTLQRRVGKYGSCFSLQLVVLLLLFFGGFIHQFSQDYVDPVPT